MLRPVCCDESPFCFNLLAWILGRSPISSHAKCFQCAHVLAFVSLKVLPALSILLTSICQFLLFFVVDSSPSAPSLGFVWASGFLCFVATAFLLLSMLTIFLMSFFLCCVCREGDSPDDNRPAFIESYLDRILSGLSLVANLLGLPILQILISTIPTPPAILSTPKSTSSFIAIGSVLSFSFILVALTSIVSSVCLRSRSRGAVFRFLSTLLPVVAFWVLLVLPIVACLGFVPLTSLIATIPLSCSLLLAFLSLSILVMVRTQREDQCSCSEYAFGWYVVGSFVLVTTILGLSPLIALLQYVCDILFQTTSKRATSGEQSVVETPRLQEEPIFMPFALVASITSSLLVYVLTVEAWVFLLPPLVGIACVILISVDAVLHVSTQFAKFRKDPIIELRVKQSMETVRHEKEQKLLEMQKAAVQQWQEEERRRRELALADGQNADVLPLEVSIDRRFVKYDRGRRLGRGKYGVVFRGTYRFPGLRTTVSVAVKKGLYLVNDPNVLREIEIARKVMNHAHPNVLQTYGMYKSSDVFYIVLELCESSVKHWMMKLRKANTLTKAIKLDVLLQLARGIHHIHSIGIIHRDLKPDNCLVKEGIVKICDFGLSSNVESMSVSHSALRGTPGYIPPSCPTPLDEDMQRCDTYAFGIICWELWTLRRAYEDVAPLYPDDPVGLVYAIHSRKLRPNVDASICRGMPRELRDLIVRCWDHHAEERPLFEEILSILNEIDI